MSFAVTNAVDVFVDGQKSIKLSSANARRRVINIWAGDSDLWFGDRDVRGGTIGNKVRAGDRVELTLKGEIYVIRQGGTAGLCSFSEELATDGTV